MNASRRPTLNRSEMLWSHYKQKTHGKTDLPLRNAIALAYRQLVRKVAHNMSDRCALPFEDLEQLGMIGALKACDRFDPTQGADFSSFAVPYIRGEMLHHLRDHGSTVKVPRRMREANAKAKTIERRWTVAQGKPPTEAEIAAQMNIKVEKLHQIRSAIAHQMALPLLDEFCDVPGETGAIVETVSPLEPTWNQLRRRFAKLPTVDQTLLHQAFVQRSLSSGVGGKRQVSRVLDRLAGL